MDPVTASKTAASTPITSPGLFSPTTNPLRHPPPAPLSDGTPHSSPYLHPLQMHKVRETHKAQVEQDFITGRKLINQYEIIDEIGRGMHGKVKLARSLETGDFVAIKIIQRFSKKRRLGRVTVSPEHKTKREIAILKKIRHPNVVGLLEVIDDPELKKIYMVLEHVELGEIVWRKKGAPQICLYERRRIEREQMGEKETADDEKYLKLVERRRQRKEAQQSKLTQLQHQRGHTDSWNTEHGEDEELDHPPLSQQITHDSTHDLSRSYQSAFRSNPGSLVGSRAGSRAPSRASSRAHTPLPTHFDIPPLDSDNEEDETPGPLRSALSNYGSSSALDGTYYGSYPDEPPNRRRSPSMADSIISHMSSIDAIPHDHFEDDYSYVPCFTLDQARSAFRDTVLGLEYLHYEGIVHRDIKPANLLWTRDHRVKISDFGVSYFGRPIREGETEENISEADATDFDDDLELAKTVGTPAFFAPELCYTDLDVEQPKVTEQIDVWSLGITLYCLIYARLPFLAEDEYQLFRCIAKEEVYIPKKRLRAVDPLCATSQATPATKRTSSSTVRYREETELAFEEIDDELCDLLRRMLIKDPAERMKLREVKRHPWVIRGIDNVIGWLDDTDPSRKTSGRRIQVDDRELERAVVPITFLERARSAVKKLGKVIGVTKSESRSEGSRRRAVSSATSSGTENFQHPPLTPLLRDSRRASLRGDESYFTSINDLQEQCEPHWETIGHPLAQSVAASPDLSTADLGLSNPSPGPLTAADDTATSSQLVGSARPPPPDRALSGTASIRTVIHRGHSYSRSVTNAPQAATWERGPKSLGLFTDHKGGILGGHLWSRRGRDAMADIDESITSRARSVDRTLFESESKHAEPSVAMSHATAPGLFEHGSDLHHPFPTRSEGISNLNMDMPLFIATQSSSTPNVPFAKYAASNLDERPATANRTPRVKTPPRRVYNSTASSFLRAHEQNNRRRKLELEEERSRQAQSNSLAPRAYTPIEPCRPSPDGEAFTRGHDQELRTQSYSSVNSNSVESQLASPSDANSSISSINLGSREQFLPSVPSLPSLPALISGASSVSADPEGEMLQRPGVVRVPEAVITAESTPETVTPPTLSKELSHEEEQPVEMQEDQDAIALSPETDEEGYNGDGDSSAFAAEHDEDSDSDEGLTMTRKKPHAKRSGGETMARRGTNASVGSTDTAKKVS